MVDAGVVGPVHGAADAAADQHADRGTADDGRQSAVAVADLRADGRAGGAAEHPPDQLPVAAPAREVEDRRHRVAGAGMALLGPVAVCRRPGRRAAGMAPALPLLLVAVGARFVLVLAAAGLVLLLVRVAAAAATMAGLVLPGVGQRRRRIRQRRYGDGGDQESGSAHGSPRLVGTRTGLRAPVKMLLTECIGQ